MGPKRKVKMKDKGNDSRSLLKAAIEKNMTSEDRNMSSNSFQDITNILGSSASLEDTVRKKGRVLAQWRHIQANKETPRTVMNQFMAVHENSAISPSDVFQPPSNSPGGSFLSRSTRSTRKINVTDVISDNEGDLIDQDKSKEVGISVTESEISLEQPTLETDESRNETLHVARKRAKKTKKPLVQAEDFDFSLVLPGQVSKMIEEDITVTTEDDSAVEERRWRRKRKIKHDGLKVNDADFTGIEWSDKEHSKMEETVKSTKEDVYNISRKFNDDTTMSPDMEDTPVGRRLGRRGVIVSTADFTGISPSLTLTASPNIDNSTTSVATDEDIGNYNTDEEQSHGDSTLQRSNDSVKVTRSRLNKSSIPELLTVSKSELLIESQETLYKSPRTTSSSTVPKIGGSKSREVDQKTLIESLLPTQSPKVLRKVRGQKKAHISLDDLNISVPNMSAKSTNISDLEFVRSIEVSNSAENTLTNLPNGSQSNVTSSISGTSETESLVEGVPMIIVPAKNCEEFNDLSVPNEDGYKSLNDDQGDILVGKSPVLRDLSKIVEITEVSSREASSLMRSKMTDNHVEDSTSQLRSAKNSYHPYQDISNLQLNSSVEAGTNETSKTSNSEGHSKTNILYNENILQRSKDSIKITRSRLNNSSKQDHLSTSRNELESVSQGTTGEPFLPTPPDKASRKPKRKAQISNENIDISIPSSIVDGIIPIVPEGHRSINNESVKVSTKSNKSTLEKSSMPLLLTVSKFEIARVSQESLAESSLPSPSPTLLSRKSKGKRKAQISMEDFDISIPSSQEKQVDVSSSVFVNENSMNSKILTAIPIVSEGHRSINNDSVKVSTRSNRSKLDKSSMPALLTVSKSEIAGVSQESLAESSLPTPSPTLLTRKSKGKRKAPISMEDFDISIPSSNEKRVDVSSSVFVKENSMTGKILTGHNVSKNIDIERVEETEVDQPVNCEVPADQSMDEIDGPSKSDKTKNSGRKSIFYSGMPENPQLETSVAVCDQTRGFMPDINSTRLPTNTPSPVLYQTSVGSQSKRKYPQISNTPSPDVHQSNQVSRPSRHDHHRSNTTNDPSHITRHFSQSKTQENLSDNTEEDKSAKMVTNNPSQSDHETRDQLREATISHKSVNFHHSVYKTRLEMEELMEGGTQTTPQTTLQTIPIGVQLMSETGCQVTPGLQQKDINDIYNQVNSHNIESFNKSQKITQGLTSNQLSNSFVISDEVEVATIDQEQRETRDHYSNDKKVDQIETMIDDVGNNQDHIKLAKQSLIDFASSDDEDELYIYNKESPKESEKSKKHVHEDSVEEDNVSKQRKVDDNDANDIEEDNVGIDEIEEDKVGMDGIEEDYVGTDDIEEDNVGVDDIEEDNVGVDDIEVDSVGNDDIEDNVGIRSNQQTPYNGENTASNDDIVPEAAKRTMSDNVEVQNMRQANLDRYLGIKDVTSQQGLSKLMSPPTLTVGKSAATIGKPKKETKTSKTVFPLKDIKFEFNRFTRYKTKNDADLILEDVSQDFIEMVMERMSEMAMSRGASKIHLCDIRQVMGECKLEKTVDEDPGNRWFYQTMRQLIRDDTVKELIPIATTVYPPYNPYPPEDIWYEKGGNKKKRTGGIKRGKAGGTDEEWVPGPSTSKKSVARKTVSRTSLGSGVKKAKKVRRFKTSEIEDEVPSKTTMKGKKK